ncbi:MAG TPA: ABC transporter ATP-binding protein [Bacteroidota bacterium]|nr:ABC transporter ATP-binding protein [Bacteroidota bacterium]
MNLVTIRAAGIGKNFNRRTVLKDITFSLSSGESLAVTGKNGSGKSTLIKVLAGLLSPTKGKVEYELSGAAVDLDGLRPTIGLVSPYLQLYDEFTALENLLILLRIRNNSTPAPADIEKIFRTYGLWERRDDVVRTFSSGMKQRLKYIVALAHAPSIVMLDEPTANLDEDGCRVVHDTVQSLQTDTLTIIATNDEREASWCKKRIHVGV